MKRKFVRDALLLIGVFGGALSLGVAAQAQAQKPAAGGHPVDIDAAVTYIGERAKIASVDCGCFWLQGGDGDVALTFFHGLGVAANLGGVHSGNISDGIGLDKFMIAAGPRYTYTPAVWSKRHRAGIREASIFGEALFGRTHAFNSVFPGSAGTQSSASSFALQFGGGINLRITRTLGLRVIEVDYLRSTLPNGDNNVQNDLRLGAGINFHFRTSIKK